jgi:hypothetical protein
MRKLTLLACISWALPICAVSQNAVEVVSVNTSKTLQYGSGGCPPGTYAKWGGPDAGGFCEKGPESTSGVRDFTSPSGNPKRVTCQGNGGFAADLRAEDAIGTRYEGEVGSAPESSNPHYDHIRLDDLGAGVLAFRWGSAESKIFPVLEIKIDTNKDYDGDYRARADITYESYPPLHYRYVYCRFYP